MNSPSCYLHFSRARASVEGDLDRRYTSCVAVSCLARIDASVSSCHIPDLQDTAQAIPDYTAPASQLRQHVSILEPRDTLWSGVA